MFQFANKEVIKYLLMLMGSIVLGIVFLVLIDHLFEKRLKTVDDYGQVFHKDMAALLRVQNDIISIKALILKATAATNSPHERLEINTRLKEYVLKIKDTCNNLGFLESGNFGYDFDFKYADKQLEVCSPLSNIIHRYELTSAVLDDRDRYLKEGVAEKIPPLAKKVRAFNKMVPIRLNALIEKNKEAIEILRNEEEKFNNWADKKKRSYATVEYLFLIVGSIVMLSALRIISRKTLRLYERMEKQLYIDQHTEVLNRFALQKTLQKEARVTLIIIDIDSFKNINELYGMVAGNSILYKLATTMSEYAQKTNQELYRISGDEFVLFSDTGNSDESVLEKRLESLYDYLKDFKVLVDEKIGKVHLEFTFGASYAVGVARESKPIAKADMALQYAKKMRLPYAIYTEQIDTKASIEHNIYWKNQVKFALKEERFVPFYQGIFDEKGKILKYEVLMRLIMVQDDGAVDYISPYEYLNVAKKAKYYDAISQDVIRQALLTCSKQNIVITINITVHDMLNSETISMLENKIQEYGIARNVIFEIVENDDIVQKEYVKEFIQKFRSIGVRFAIDDFGAGFSNFSFILSIMPDFIKIDGSLIKNIAHEQHSYELVKSIVAFAKALKIVTIAEFVHNEAVFEIVKGLGVDQFQGYYFEAPKILDVKSAT